MGFAQKVGVEADERFFNNSHVLSGGVIQDKTGYFASVSISVDGLEEEGCTLVP